MRFGPQIQGDQVRFRLWSPDCDDVALQVQDKGVFAMTAADDGWLEAVVPCGPGTRYRFQIGETVFPDPASRLQEGGIHGWSVVTQNIGNLPWTGRVWEETVLYECHPGLMGGFAGIADKLEDLADLGITAIELMPIAAFPGTRNWGYDGVLPFAPAEAYGTPAELAALIAQAHARKVMVFLDVVYNHFGPDGNYLPLYAKSFFRADMPTPWGAAIDFRVPQVRQFYDENARHWLFEIGFDGLRFDAVHAIADEGWLNELAAMLRREAGGRHIHLVLENEDNIAGRLRPHGAVKQFDAQWNDDIHHVLHVLLTGESNGYYQDFASEPAARLAKALTEGFVYQGDASANRHGDPRGEPSADLPPSAFVAFLQNHDQIGNRAFGERLTVLADQHALKAAAALVLLMPQIPMLFMGEEIGSATPFLYFTDHDEQLAQAVRDGRRKEFAAFCGPEGAELPDPNAVPTFDQSRPRAETRDAQDWRSFYKALLTLRRTRISPHLRGAAAVGAQTLSHSAVIARWRLENGELLCIAVNLGSAPVGFAAPAGQPVWGALADGALGALTTVVWITQ